MTKYKLVGILNFFFGFPILLLALSFFFVIPKLTPLYSEFGANTSGNISTSYLSVVVLLAISAVNIFFGIKGFSNTQNKDAYFNYSLITAIVTFLLSGTIVGLMVISVIFPLYNLTSQ